MTRSDKIWQLLETIEDPEIPVINIVELGIVRDVKFADGDPIIVITPTYSGCPAMAMIEIQIKAVLHAEGFSGVRIETVFSPAWTTDWIPEKAKNKLQKYGIAAPSISSAKARSLGMLEEQPVSCPNCKSSNTSITSEFGSTACKALYKCQDCLEPFDYFKCH